ncbi:MULTISPECIES: bifunctional MaoC family dehydratase N-terminal/OB-fold nucleic acid binding domain-containing protein [unclassified Streptomyces]|uniref:bifunctional MaoC family dehydratase N-terminal/OB-fold nucleic acid binding domain-containing protein n=1 Tax=unclassified Streptomyces TaxID=2593676 RepID=UPI003D713EE4
MQDDLAVRLKGYEGRAAVVAAPGRDPVDAAMIRHWCEAVGDTNPAFTGPDAVAPPAMLQVWTMAGLSGPHARTPAYAGLLALLDAAGCTSVVATDCEQEYVRTLRPGDEITFDTVIESVSDRKTTRLGTGYFITTRTDIRVGPDLAGTHRFRVLKYAPAAARSAEPAEPAEPAERVRPGESSARRPRPVVNRDNAGFWAGVRDHRLLIQRCTACRTLRLPWLPGCAACGAPGWDTVEACGAGTVHSYVVVHHPRPPGFDPPYAVALVELAEGVRTVAGVSGVPYDEVRIGMPVRLAFRAYDEELVLPVFEGVPDAAG